MSEPPKKRARQNEECKSIPIPYNTGSFVHETVFYDLTGDYYTDCYKRPGASHDLINTYTDELEAYKHAYEYQWETNIDSEYTVEIPDDLYEDFDWHISELQSERIAHLPKEVQEAVEEYWSDIRYDDSDQVDKICEMVKNLNEKFPDQKEFDKDIFYVSESDIVEVIEKHDNSKYERKLPDDASANRYESGLRDLHRARPKSGHYIDEANGSVYDVVERSVKTKVNVPEGFALVKLSDLESL